MYNVTAIDPVLLYYKSPQGSKEGKRYNGEDGIYLG